MSPDICLTIGVILAIFSIPAIVSAVTGGRSPRAPSLVILIAGVLMIYALNEKPGGYALFDIPDVMLRTMVGLVS